MSRLQHSTPPPPLQHTAVERLSSISAQMTTTSTTSFSAGTVPQAPEDPLFGLMQSCRSDTFEKKVDLVIGAYRDNNAKPWVLPVVKKVC
jgi:aspartate aminotransferase